MKMKGTILASAVALARAGGLMRFTRAEVAADAGCSEANVSYHYGTVEKLRTAVVEFALANADVEVLAQARALRHPALHGRMTAALKERVANHITR